VEPAVFGENSTKAAGIPLFFMQIFSQKKRKSASSGV